MKKYRDIVGDGGSNIVGQVEAQQARLQSRLARIRRIVAVASGKGGVGKSTVTANLAAAFALSGSAVGVLDADLNGPSMAKLLGIRGQLLTTGADGVEPPRSALGVRAMSMDLLLTGDRTPLAWEATTQAESHTWRGTMEANALREFLADTAWGDLDVLILDLAPGAERLATVLGLVPELAGVVVVTIPSDTSVPVLGLVENMAGYACADCGAVNPLFSGPGGQALAAEFGVPFLGAVPFDPRLAAAADRGLAFVAADARSPAARALLALAETLRAALAARAGP